jgi:predicted RND superfamily exporter protein
MWEMIDRMFGDTLWIYTAIGGALIGAAFLAWFKETRAGLWGYAKFDQTLDYLVKRWGWTWLQEPPDAWRKKYPKVTKKIDELELRIKTLESQSNTKIIKQKEK